MYKDQDERAAGSAGQKATGRGAVLGKAPALAPKMWVQGIEMGPERSGHRVKTGLRSGQSPALAPAAPD